ncbi:unnamed protein product [Alternaria alternata]
MALQNPHSDASNMTIIPTSRIPDAISKEEDWSGKPSSERRKLQNRLNQRARQLEQVIRQFADAAYIRYLQNAPLLSHLPTIIHLNILNALAGNVSVLGLSKSWLLCDSVSPLTQHRPLELACPRVLFPTVLQLTTSHHPWVDLFPLPQFRDNILRAAIQDPHFDEDELWFDLLETKCAPGSAESPSLLVWGEPWDIWKWEVNIEFLRKWSHLLDGCTTLLESTNYWRRRRGERPISFSSNPTESRR